MGFDRNTLYSAVDALSRTAAAIGSFLDSEAAVSGLEYLEELRQDTEDKLQKVSLFLNDEWNGLRAIMLDFMRYISSWTIMRNSRRVFSG